MKITITRSDRWLKWLDGHEDRSEPKFVKFSIPRLGPPHVPFPGRWIHARARRGADLRATRRPTFRHAFTSDRIAPICVYASRRRHNGEITGPPCPLHQARRWWRIRADTWKNHHHVDFHSSCNPPSPFFLFSFSLRGRNGGSHLPGPNFISPIQLDRALLSEFEANL